MQRRQRSRTTIGCSHYPLCDPFSAVLVNISGGRIQCLLHHAGLREPTGGGGGKRKGGHVFYAPQESAKESYLAHSGWLDTVSLIRLLVTLMM